MPPAARRKDNKWRASSQRWPTAVKQLLTEDKLALSAQKQKKVALAGKGYKPYDASTAMSKEYRHLYNMAREQKWTPSQYAYLERIKNSIIGSTNRYSRRLVAGDPMAPCAWDCYRRATMLEPLAHEIFATNVPGDFLEAGVLYGGVSIFMAALLRAAGQLGSRRMYIADSFEGMPPATSYSASFAGSEVGRAINMTDGSLLGNMQGKYRDGKLKGTLDLVKANVRKHLPTFDAGCASAAGLPAAEVPEGVHFLKGFFNESLPGPVKSVSLLRLDSDIFTSIYESLDKLYPLLSPGGFVVFDDWKITQARAAALLYRQRHGIKGPIWGSDQDNAPPFWSLDRIAFWQKGGDSTRAVRVARAANAQVRRLA